MGTKKLDRVQNVQNVQAVQSPTSVLPRDAGEDEGGGWNALNQDRAYDGADESAFAIRI